MAELNSNFQNPVHDPALNGFSDEALPELEATVGEALALPRLDAARKVFIASNGAEIALTGKAINPMFIERLQSQGKPAVPKVEVTIGGKYKQVVDNPESPAYQEALAAWRSEAGIRTAMYLFSVGLKMQPPPEFVAETSEFMPGLTANEMKYMYVTSLLPTPEDVTALVEVIMGAALPTDKGISDTANFTG